MNNSGNSPSAEYELIRVKSEVYGKYKPFFQFLEKLFWLQDHFLAKLGERDLKFHEISKHEHVILTHLSWLGGQIWAALLCLNEVLNSQAAQLIRSIWEAKVNLLYIAKKPSERSQAFIEHLDKEIEELKKDVERAENDQSYSSLIPSEFKKLPSLSDVIGTEKTWPKLFVRAKDVGLENEYRSIYKIDSWKAHVTFGALTSYLKVDPQYKAFDPNQDPENVPFHLCLTSAFALSVFREIEKNIKIWTGDEAQKLEEELENLWEKLSQDYQPKGNFSELLENYRQAIAGKKSSKNT